MHSYIALPPMLPHAPLPLLIPARHTSSTQRPGGHVRLEREIEQLEDVAVDGVNAQCLDRR